MYFSCPNCRIACTMLNTWAVLICFAGIVDAKSRYGLFSHSLRQYVVPHSDQSIRFNTHGVYLNPADLSNTTDYAWGDLCDLVDQGIPSYIIFASSGKCLSLLGDLVYHGAIIFLWPCWEQDNQRWIAVKHDESGKFQLKMERRTWDEEKREFCLTVKPSVTDDHEDQASHANFTLSACNPNGTDTRQFWYFVDLDAVEGSGYPDGLQDNSSQ